MDFGDELAELQKLSVSVATIAMGMSPVPDLATAQKIISQQKAELEKYKEENIYLKEELDNLRNGRVDEILTPSPKRLKILKIN